MKICLTIIMLFAAYNSSAPAARPQSSDLVGRWKIDMAFENESKRSFSFDAEDSGRGSLLLELPQDNWIEPARPSQVKWMTGDEKNVTFSAPVAFPAGEAGRETGMLVFKGTFKSEIIITGDIEFFHMDQNPMDSKAVPFKTGKFE